jgi:hypothetical protein
MLLPKLMYGIPLAYINSGIKRKYMLEILDKTDAILDGHSQDVYTGLVNLAINDHYYHINYPITMAAISGFSSGATSILGSTSSSVAIERGNEELLTNVMMPVQRDIEDFLHPSDGDVTNMVCQFLRLIDIGCIPIETVKKIPWFIIGCNIAKQIQYKDINITKIKKQLIHSIRMFSKEDADNLQTGFEHNLIPMNHYEVIEGKDYFKGFRSNGCFSVDATEFGVHDVYDACVLFKKLVNIY